MDARVSINKIRNGTNFESERSLLKGSLHLSGTEESEISHLGGRSALAVLLSQSLEVVGAVDLRADVLDVGNGLVLGASNLLVSVPVEGVS